MIARVKALFARYREQLLYLIFGGMTTVIDWVISFCLYRFWIDATQAPDAAVHAADALAWVAAVLFAYVTNRIWVFESKKHGAKAVLSELTAFAGGRVLTFLLQEGIMFCFVTWLGWNKYLFRIITAVLVIVLNYIFSKLLVFSKKTAGGEPDMKTNVCFTSADILLPDFQKIAGSTWSTVACDQYTSEPEYWQQVEACVGNNPSTLRLMLPELYLGESAQRIPQIHAAMEQALREQLIAHPNAMIYLERVQSDGRVRKGIIGAVDLESYDYHAGSTSLVRATEGTVLERIPPRVAVRRGAALELPHVMLLIDDPNQTVIEPLSVLSGKTAPIYDFDLMLNGGHVTGYLLNGDLQEQIKNRLSALVTPQAMQERYGDASLSALLFAVGDGNHSLATAKAAYEEIKAQLGETAARLHPARYALAEVVNLHDDALGFEPIYRVVFGADPQDLITALKQHLQALNGAAEAQSMCVICGTTEETLSIPHPVQQLTVGTLQRFLDAYCKEHPTCEIDYIHGEESLRKLAGEPNTIGFLFDGMKKSELFRTVLYDGALPRKTFSMGHAPDKRYYLECRQILLSQ